MNQERQSEVSFKSAGDEEDPAGDLLQTLSSPGFMDCPCAWYGSEDRWICCEVYFLMTVEWEDSASTSRAPPKWNSLRPSRSACTEDVHHSVESRPESQLFEIYESGWLVPGTGRWGTWIVGVSESGELRISFDCQERSSTTRDRPQIADGGVVRCCSAAALSSSVSFTIEIGIPIDTALSLHRFRSIAPSPRHSPWSPSFSLSAITPALPSS